MARRGFVIFFWGTQSFHKGFENANMLEKGRKFPLVCPKSEIEKKDALGKEGRARCGMRSNVTAGLRCGSERAQKVGRLKSVSKANGIETNEIENKERKQPLRKS